MDGTPFDVTFNNLVMDVDDTGDPTLLELDGHMDSLCFGGTATLATAPSLSVPSGDVCPVGGVVTVTLPSAAAELRYQADGSVEIDSDGDGTPDRVMPNCLDPRLFMCASTA